MEALSKPIRRKTANIQTRFETLEKLKVMADERKVSISGLLTEFVGDKPHVSKAERDLENLRASVLRQLEVVDGKLDLLVRGQVTNDTMTVPFLVELITSLASGKDINAPGYIEGVSNRLAKNFKEQMREYEG